VVERFLLPSRKCISEMDLEDNFSLERLAMAIASSGECHSASLPRSCGRYCTEISFDTVSVRVCACLYVSASAGNFQYMRIALYLLICEYRIHIWIFMYMHMHLHIYFHTYSYRIMQTNMHIYKYVHLNARMTAIFHVGRRCLPNSISKRIFV